jgi:gliding motility-associated-like protein
MNKFYVLVLLFFSAIAFRSQTNCNTAAPFCTGTTYNFPASTNTTAQTGPDYDCLLTQPNPAWYYLQVSQSGQIVIDMYSSASVDIDFICWGPFSSPYGPCVAGLTSNTVVDCSYSTAAFETCTIPNAVVGQYYMLLITNFSNQTTNIVFSQSNAGQGGAGATNCNILCNITSMNANPGPCNASTNTFDVTGTINTYAPPNSGTLTITSSCGGSTVINPPFATSTNYTLTGVPATGTPCTVTASYSADPLCTFSVTINAPAPCNTVPCAISSVIATPGPCDAATNNFDLSGTITFSNAPSSGSLTVTSSCGGTQTFNAPFNSPTSYTLSALPSNGATCTVTAVFSAVSSCSATATFTSPASCASCTTTAANNGPICEGQTLNLTCSTAGATSYAWSGPNFNSAIQNPTISNATANASGVYTVTVTLASGAICVATTTVTVNPSPPADAGQTVVICTGGNVQLNASGGTSYSWTPATGLSNNAINNPVASPASTTQYTVTVGANGCFQTDTITVFVLSQVTATVNPNVSICLGQSAQLSAGGGSSYQWIPATGLSSSSIANPTATPNVTTTYSVIVSTSGGCPNDTAVVTVTVSPPFSITVSANDTICAGQAGTVSASGANSYVWFPGGSTNSSLTASPSITTTYTVAGSNGLCADTQTVAIIVIPSPVAAFSNSQQSTLGNYAVCFTNNSINYIGNSGIWDFGDSTGIVDQNPCFTFPDAGTYQVCLTVVNALGCPNTYCEDLVLKPDWTLYVPNSFTPDGDGTNDVFYAFGVNLQSFEMYIYDRWGNLTFYTKDITEGWNGKKNNKGAEVVQIDTYVWRVNITDSDGKPRKYTGHVNVVK